MKRVIVGGLIAGLLAIAIPGAALAGVGPSPFTPPGQVRNVWTAPGQLVGFAPQPEPPLWTPIAQTKGEPPGQRDLWISPGQLVGFAPQPEPPLWTPVMQANNPQLPN